MEGDCFRTRVLKHEVLCKYPKFDCGDGLKEINASVAKVSEAWGMWNPHQIEIKLLGVLWRG